ncbi:MAG: lspA [Chlorobi bacterium]|nr:lspA [Chlorobiota bacterium]
MRKLLSLSALIVLIDQAAKLAIRGFDLFGIHHAGMQMYESKEVFGDFFRLTYVENPGMAFGLNFGMPVILSIFSIAAAVFLVYLLKRTESDGMSGLRIALALILGGAVGNLVDRAFYGVIFDYAPLFYGKVVDFVDIDIPDIKLFGNELRRFYVFNIADAAVSIGVVLLLIFYPSKKHVLQSGSTPSPIDGELRDDTMPHREITAES